MADKTDEQGTDVNGKKISNITTKYTTSNLTNNLSEQREYKKENDGEDDIILGIEFIEQSRSKLQS